MRILSLSSGMPGVPEQDVWSGPRIISSSAICSLIAYPG
jgi:hypothetical protein